MRDEAWLFTSVYIRHMSEGEFVVEARMSSTRGQVEQDEALRNPRRTGSWDLIRERRRG